MWTVLLDHSSSMGEGFVASAKDAAPRDRHSHQQSKLAAAVENLMATLEWIPNETPIALFGFTSSARLLTSGVVGDSARISDALAALRPTDGTDIAAALDRVRHHFASTASAPPVKSVLLVTDGLSDVTKARSAAERCTATGIQVMMILIDPTDQARALANAVATGGCQPVYGTEELAEATAGVTNAMLAGPRLKAARARAAARRNEVHAEAAGKEPVEFTAAFPGRLPRGGAAELHVFVHQPSMRAQLEAEVATLRTRSPLTRTAHGDDVALRVKRRSRIWIEPVIDGIQCYPSTPQLVVWENALEHREFTLLADSTAGVREGTVEVSVEQDGMRLVAARIPVSIQVGESQAAWETRTVRMVSKVFASYAREDNRIVERFWAAYRALGIELFVDLDMPPGVVWEPFLREQIDDSDAFQLFWSDESAGSPNVAAEWQHALATASAKRGASFIKPVFWADTCPAVPPELNHLHFRKFDPADLGLLPDGESRTHAEKPSPSRLQLRVPVLSFVTDTAAAITASRAESALRGIVPFLESLTELRYYPPVTCLVDAATVHGVRRETEPDARPRPDLARDEGSEVDLPEATEQIVDRIGRVLLRFHRTRYAHTLIHAEDWFEGDVRTHLAGARQRETLRELPTNKALEELRLDNFPAYASRYLALISQQVAEYLRSCSPDERRQLGADYPEELRAARDQVLRLIRAKPPVPRISRLIRTGAPTLGVFRYRDDGLAPGKSVRSFLPHPEIPVVLLSVNTFDLLADSVRADGVPEAEVSENVVVMLSSTLAHEHAHGILALGVDEQGRAATGLRNDEWTTAANLNEAIATWIQGHYQREDPDAFEEWRRYVVFGEYPSWPYRGAETVEALYQRDGVGAVQRLIRDVRHDPDAAQRHFDDLVQNGLPAPDPPPEPVARPPRKAWSFRRARRTTGP
ncbi:TIR domain-containing protein [Cryptosporangium aurantiacum]|uniref:von Willebrand factor type A domain-containing protein n=1 Tax=Cryptosporangium aurantiacum TaxID=134849 RepID=A0A1M7L1S8_9ACTN|nr:TIR domain-containing protein [Cryptosporangium aurantiacum]SHM71659.1 von Willebrand factor type A domain-containing protein [Cryptosporangium aurantiacum]